MRVLPFYAGFADLNLYGIASQEVGEAMIVIIAPRTGPRTCLCRLVTTYIALPVAPQERAAVYAQAFRAG